MYSKNINKFMVAYIPRGQKITFFSFVVYKGYVFSAVLPGTGKQLFSLVAKAFTKCQVSCRLFPSGTAAFFLCDIFVRLQVLSNKFRN